MMEKHTTTNNFNKALLCLFYSAIKTNKPRLYQESIYIIASSKVTDISINGPEAPLMIFCHTPTLETHLRKILFSMEISEIDNHKATKICPVQCLQPQW